MNEKEKQIEEMALTMCEGCATYTRGCEHTPCDTVIDSAAYLYNAGYRKQRVGEWKLGKSGCMYFCSECNYVAHPREVDEWSCCPKCGAKMGGGEE